MKAVVIERDAAVSPGRSVWLTALCVGLIALALRCCFLTVLYDGDMELFVYMGKLVGQGGRIGIELIDNKLPTVGLLMWLPYRLLGDWWGGYALLSIAMAIGAVLAITRAAALVHASSRWPTFAMAAVWMTFPLAVFSAFKLEHVQLLTGALSAMAFIQCWRTRDWRDAFTLGLCAGLGAWAKPSALSVCAAAAIAICIWASVPLKTRLRLCLAMLAGVAVPTAVLGIYLIQSGAIVGLPALYRQIRLYNENSVWLPVTMAMKLATVGLLLAVPMLMRLILERRHRLPRCSDHAMLIVFAATWLAIEFVGVALQGRMYGYHFLPLTVPATLLFAIIPRRAKAITIFGSAAPVLTLSIAWTWAAVLGTQRPSDRLGAIAYIEAHARPSDSAWMDDNARLLVETNLSAGARVPLTFLFSNHDDAPQAFSSLLLQDFRARSPEWIVLPTHWSQRADFICRTQPEFQQRPKRAAHFVQAWTAIADYVQARYVPVARCGEESVYRLAPAGAVAHVDPGER